MRQPKHAQKTASAPSNNDFLQTARSGSVPLGDGPPCLARPIWQALVKAMEIEPFEKVVLDGVLREINDKQIAFILGAPVNEVKSAVRRLRSMCKSRSKVGVVVRLLHMATTPRSGLRASALEKSFVQ